MTLKLKTRSRKKAARSEATIRRTPSVSVQADRRALSPHLRRAILRAWKNKCAYCRGKATEVDHIYPFSKGGTDELENYAPACRTCNAMKSDLVLEEGYLQILRAKAKALKPQALRLAKGSKRQVVRWNDVTLAGLSSLTLRQRKLFLELVAIAKSNRRFHDQRLRVDEITPLKGCGLDDLRRDMEAITEAWIGLTDLDDTYSEFAIIEAWNVIFDEALDTEVLTFRVTEQTHQMMRRKAIFPNPDKATVDLLESLPGLALYEFLLRSWTTKTGRGGTDISLAQFENMMSLPEDLSRDFRDLRDDVFLPAIAEVNAATEFDLDYRIDCDEATGKCYQFRFFWNIDDSKRGAA